MSQALDEEQSPNHPNIKIDIEETMSEEDEDDLQNDKKTTERRTGPVRRSKKGGWTTEEDSILTKAVEKFGGKSWKKIAECLDGRKGVQCLHRWQKVLNPNLIKGPWTKEEDEAIVNLVKIYGAKNWTQIASNLEGRIGKQCRERYEEKKEKKKNLTS